MAGNPHPSVPHRTDSTHQPRKTPAGFAVAVALSAAFPLALLALAYPAVASTLLVAVGGVVVAVRDGE